MADSSSSSYSRLLNKNCMLLHSLGYGFDTHFSKTKRQEDSLEYSRYKDNKSLFRSPRPRAASTPLSVCPDHHLLLPKENFRCSSNEPNILPDKKNGTVPNGSQNPFSERTRRNKSLRKAVTQSKGRLEEKLRDASLRSNRFASTPSTSHDNSFPTNRNIPRSIIRCPGSLSIDQSAYATNPSELVQGKFALDRTSKLSEPGKSALDRTSKLSEPGKSALDRTSKLSEPVKKFLRSLRKESHMEITDGASVAADQVEVEHENCPVCLERFLNKQEISQLPCFHRFHSDCLKQWLEICSNCPYCRADVNQH